jgi:UDP-glucose 4-epimerase
MPITGDGKTTRDYVHVSDVVRANICAWQKDVPAGLVINIGTGRQISVNEIADMIGGERTSVPARKGELRVAEANIECAKSSLDWEPMVVFEEGLAELKKEWGL